MAIFGGSSSKSYSTTLMQDQRVIAEEAEVMAGTGAVVTMPYSQLIKGPLVTVPGKKARVDVGDITLQPYTPEVRQTVSELIETVQLVSTKTVPALAKTFGEATQRTTEVLGEKLQETQLGQAAILPGMAKYLLIAVVVIIVARKVWK